jgi:hypothetical protein
VARQGQGPALETALHRTDLPETKVCTFPQGLYDKAQKEAWTVITMKNDWKRIFAFKHP